MTTDIARGYLQSVSAFSPRLIAVRGAPVATRPSSDWRRFYEKNPPKAGGDFLRYCLYEAMQ